MTKLFRRLYRLNFENNPEILPIDVINNLLSFDESGLRSLNNVLMKNEEKLYPLNLDLFSLSDIDLFNHNLIQVYNFWVKKNFPEKFHLYSINGNQEKDVVDLVRDSVKNIVTTNNFDDIKCFDDIVKLSIIYAKLDDFSILRKIDNIKQLSDGSKKEILSFLNEGLFDPKESKHRLVFEEVLTNLIKNNSLTAKEAIPFVQKIIEGDDALVKNISLKLVSELLKTQQITAAEAMPFLQKGIVATKDTIEKTLDIIKKLVKSHQITIIEAIPFLKKGMESNYSSVIDWTLNFIEILMLSKQITIAELLPFLQQAMAGTRDNVQKTLEIVKKLVENEEITVKEAIPFLEKGMKSKDVFIINWILNFVKELVIAKNISVIEVMPFLKKGITNLQVSSKIMVLDIVEILIENRQINSKEALFLSKKN